ncbi:MAG TPA: hypothetical protein PKC90_04265 [Phycisphaerales bacterium]|nr:hypothetical protein [Phycisphaerales bacterium]
MAYAEGQRAAPAATETVYVEEVRTAPARPRSTGTGCNYAPAVGPDQRVTMMAFPTGDPNTSALCVFQVMPAQVRLNTAFAHEIHVLNCSNLPLENVVITDEGTRNLTVIDSTPAATRGSGGVHWNIGDLGPCEHKIIRVNSRATSVGEAGNCLSASYSSQLCAVTSVVDPRLEIVKKAPAEVRICDPILLEFVVTNSGSGSLSNISIADSLPAGLTVNGASSLNLPVGTLAAGESRTLQASARADRVGTFENVATASSGDISATSNRTRTVVKQPKLELICDPEGSEFVNRTLTITYTVRNTSDVPCPDVRLTKPIPNTTAFIRATEGGALSGNNIVWNLGTLAPGASRTVVADLRTQAITTVISTATATGDCVEPVTVNCSSEIRGVPAVLLEVVDLIDPVEIGTETTYVISVTNQGSADDTEITMLVELPSNFEFVSAGGATQPRRTGNVIEFTPYARLAPGARIEWRVVARGKTEGNVRSSFKMTTAETRAFGPVEETESTTIYD